MGKFFRKLWVIKTDDCERNDPSSVLLARSRHGPGD